MQREPLLNEHHPWPSVTSIQISDSKMLIQCYGTKITLDVSVTADGKAFDAGSRLTVNKDLNWVE